METIYVVYGAIVLGLLVVFLFPKRKSKTETDDAEDDSFFVDGVRVRYDEISELVNGDPEEGVKQKKDTMFREDLMQFEGEFLIPGLPLNEERRLSIDDAFLYLRELFGEDLVIRKPVLTFDDLVSSAEMSQSEIIPLAHNIAGIMDIDPASLSIGFFKDKDKAVRLSPDGSYEHDGAAGLYYGKDEQGRYIVTFADDLHLQPERLIATIAHEFAHIKLLGEERMDENSEELTDMLPLFYGFGLFNSNSVFKLTRDNTSWSTHRLGYLSQADWAYLFALYRYVREEEEPAWLEHLNKTIAKESTLAYHFILANPDKVLQRQN